MSTEAGVGESQAHIVNPANAVTVLRLVLAFVLVVLYVRYGWDEAARLMYCAVFALAMATDWVDGYLAKTFGWETEFGQWLDPLADKINVGSALVVLSVQYPVLWIVTVLILAREGLMTLMRSVARQRGQGSMPVFDGSRGRARSASCSSRCSPASALCSRRARTAQTPPCPGSSSRSGSS